MFCQQSKQHFSQILGKIFSKSGFVSSIHSLGGRKLENTKNLSNENAVVNPALLYERTYHYITDSNKIPRYVVPTVGRLLRYQGANEYCFPSLKTLAKDLKVSVQTVLNHIRILKDAGVLKVVQQINANGGWGNNRYYLKTDFLSWVTKEMLEDESKPYYKEYYDALTLNTSGDSNNVEPDVKESSTEKESVSAKASNIYDINFLEESSKYINEKGCINLDKIEKINCDPFGTL